MKTSIYIIAFSLVLSLFVEAQTVRVISREKLAQKGMYPTLNVSGNKLLYTSDGYSGLNMLDLTTKQLTEISKDAGAGYEPQFAPDDSKIYFRKTSFVDNRKYNAVSEFELKSGAKKELLSPQRSLNKIQTLKNGVIAFSGKNLLRATTVKSNQTPVFVTANEDLKILVYNNNKLQFLNPLNMPESRYIWVSLSPDSKKILFTAAGKGTYVCDLNGKILYSLGYLNAPVWFNDNYVVGMEDKDDGQQIVSSKIIMISVDKKSKTIISDEKSIAMYPAASGKANRIAYQTENSEIEIVTVKIQ